MKTALQPITCLLMLGFVLSSAIARDIQLTQSGTGAPPIENISDNQEEKINSREKGMDVVSLGVGGGWHGDFDIEYSDSDFQMKSILQRCDKEYFAGGSGTEADPWLIETAEHLDNIRYFLGPQNSDSYFKQIAHIDLGVPPWNQDEGWMPIGYVHHAYYFMGNYNGNGFTINNLTINRPWQNGIGLFGAVSEAVLHAIGLEDVIIHGLSSLGALAGSIRNTTITKSFATGEIVAQGNWAGGLVGVSYLNNIIDRCFANVNVFAEGYSVGGITGTNEAYSSITNSYATCL